MDDVRARLLRRHRAGRRGSAARGAIRAGGEPGAVLAPEPAPPAAGGAGVERRHAVRRPGHGEDARVRRAAVGHQPRPDVPHRRPVARSAAPPGRALLHQPGAGGRGEPLRQPVHRAQRAPAASPGPPPAPLPAVPVGPPGRARARRFQGGRAADLPVRRPLARGALQRAADRDGGRAGRRAARPRREATRSRRCARVVDSPDLWVEFTIDRGQIQYLNNREFAHSRTDFRDAPEPSGSAT